MNPAARDLASALLGLSYRAIWRAENFRLLGADHLAKESRDLHVVRRVQARTLAKQAKEYAP